MTSPYPTQNKYPYQHEPIWSRSEKRIARRVFNAALRRELHAVMREAKQMANQISDPADLWDLERYLTQHRKDIDSKYAFRSSRLSQVLGRLMCEGRIAEDELRDLPEDKIAVIHSRAKVLAENAA